MNRVFDIALAAGTALLAGFFLLLAAGLLLTMIETAPAAGVSGPRILSVLRVSLLSATVSAALATGLGIPTAYLLSRKDFFGKTALDTLLDLPLVLSPVAVGAMLLIFFSTGFGRRLDGLFGPFVLSPRGIIVAQFVIVVGLAVRLLKAAFDGVDREYENISRTLGLGPGATMLRVVLPISRRGVLAAFLLVWGRALGEFGATVTLVGATPFRTETAATAIHLSLESGDLAGGLFFVAILLAVSMTILYLVRKI